MPTVYLPQEEKDRLDSLKEQFDEEYTGSIDKSEILKQAMDLWENQRLNGGV